jgi:hypothetical protein
VTVTNESILAARRATTLPSSASASRPSPRGPTHDYNDAISIVMRCDDQVELDR